MQSWVRKKNHLGCTLVAWLEVIIHERVKIMKWHVLIDCLIERTEMKHKS
jgi:hypothetical protein